MINSEGRQANVLVTGGGGMVAQELKKLLVEEGAIVTTSDLSNSQISADISGDLRSRVNNLPLDQNPSDKAHKMFAKKVVSKWIK